jgi:hypothetical protein
MKMATSTIIPKKEENLFQKLFSVGVYTLIKTGAQV